MQKDGKNKNRSSNPASPILNSRGGQLLIEMLVALGILTVGFLSVITLLSRALGLNRVVADNYTATYLATEGIEVAKNILDSNAIRGRGWNEGFGDGSYELESSSSELSANQDRYLTFDPESRRYGYGFSDTTPFKRVISVALNGQNEVVVNSRVDWVSRGGGTFNVNLEDHFFNWR